MADDESHEHQPDNVIRADHITYNVCECGTFHLVLWDATGEPIAVAPFPVEAIEGLLADDMRNIADMHLASRPGARN